MYGPVCEISITPLKRIILILFLFGVLMWIGADLLADLEDNEPISSFYSDRKEPLPTFGLQNRQNRTLNHLSPDSKTHQGPPFPGSSAQHLHVFMQISDLHISKFYDAQRVPDFEKFCRSNIDIIQPEVVLASGDLTDAKQADTQGSSQFVEEWMEYARVLKETGVTQKTVWLDLRGNHDAFDVPSLDSPMNFYRNYSHQGQNHSRSYRYEHKTTSGDTYSFIAVDGCPDPGLRRPFNFFGIITQNDLAQLQNLSTQSQDSNMTIWFGHYTTSTLLSNKRLRQILGQGPVYLGGHLHTLGGLLPSMYVRQQTGFLELELGDWKDNRIYRVFAVDHDLFSFTDEVFGTWPVILVTNPKHGQFNVPQLEPTGRMSQSTHIRVLVFSEAELQSVRVQVDGQEYGEAQHVQGPLYVVAWQPDLYATGVHYIDIFAKDAAGNERRVHQPFTLDNTHIPFNLFSRYILMSDHTAIFKTLFCITFALTVLPLLLCKLCRVNVEVSPSGPCWRGCLRLVQLWVRRYQLLCSTRTVYWPLLTYHIYVAIGPWFVGELMDKHIGAFFVFGALVDGMYIPGSLTFAYGFAQLLVFNIPLTLYLGGCLDRCLCQHKGHSASHSTLACCSTAHTVLVWTLNHAVFFCLVTMQAYLVLGGFFLAYGTMAFILCPLRTWSIFMAFYLRYAAMRRRPSHSTMEAGDTLVN